MASDISGWVILDKPTGITSARAVEKVKRLLKKPKIGHAGTLDPLASGILPLALGEATKTVPYMMDAGKAYAFTVTWGQERDTDDSQGQVTESSDKRPSLAEIMAILPEFIGAIQQMPPDYSAIKVDGKRAYDAARDGKPLELKAREVIVESLTVIPAKAGIHADQRSMRPDVDPGLRRDDETAFICHCGKGTYIRSLARDMGQKLGCFGHISVLRRLKVGQFDESCAISLEVLEEMVHKGDLSFLRPVEAALDDILAWDVSPDQAMLLKRGQTIPLMEEQPQGTKVRIRAGGTLVAIGEVLQDSVKPVRVFNL